MSPPVLDRPTRQERVSDVSCETGRAGSVVTPVHVVSSVRQSESATLCELVTNMGRALSYSGLSDHCVLRGRY